MSEPTITGDSASAIADSVRDLIARGELRPGDVLPSVRALAVRRGVNRNTVAAGYAALAAAGIVETRRRGGTVVRALVPVAGEGAPAPGVAVNLADGNPDPALLPALPDLRGYSTVLYGSPGIDEGLGRWAERHLLPDAGPDGALVLTHGAVDAVERVLSAHLTRGDAVAVEDPCFLSSIGTLRLNGYRPVPVPVDEHGMTTDGLRAALRAGVRAVVCTPRAHNPTGASLTARRAEELRAPLAAHPEVLVIEDDHFSALARTPYRRVTPVGTARWALVRSVSKFLGPDMRLALTVCDRDTADRLRARPAGWVSHVLQHLVAGVLTDSATPARLDHASRTYADRRRSLTDALTAHGLSWSEAADGLNVWIPLTGVPETAVVNALADHGWAVRPGSLFTLAHGPAIRVTTSTLLPEHADAFAARLAATLASITSESPCSPA
ncbi:aminotransferase class I/II-fold pyridoxal phosphate-dependent enzyme [Nocardiopsis lambiniae]|uniref:Aminotransferase class I/II-fold pyridoxal phosphate-dependent enzyme n=1 Tax=Nocardiopsis lambiniae TaxID=3075539 RepID=A0ABU2MI51_9ACTN|nr:aminotransferase class I/II-fold pyridoxal phosphate-dependent enzyme [Nocardiopsis sp. DSM 44743]MDT0331536.1 aminotransferase class I/II-fold pyridoxal phosphate-dependent enzyme [Nocardiopsis sp. DSM 44743]